MTCTECGRAVTFDERVGYLHTVPPAYFGGSWHLADVAPVEPGESRELHPAGSAAA